MIGQMRLLRRVKHLKQENALRAMRAKRTEAEAAKQAADQALEIVKTSAASLPARCDAVYDEILGRVIDLGGVDDARGKVLRLEKDHERLQDDWERAAHVQTRVEEELQAAVAFHNQAMKLHDKYIIITDDMTKQVEDEAANKEEAEIEDLFARPRRRIA